MTAFPRSPRLNKGAIIALGPGNRPKTVVLFQYNPETMSRRLEARVLQGNDTGDRTEALRLEGPPRETITLKIELDASDQLESKDPVAVEKGIYPALATLELLLYPESKIISRIGQEAMQGVMEIIPPEMPLTLFVWGPNRVVPVKLTGMTINEQAYDPQLNPIQAQVDLSLEVLTTSDFRPEDPGYSLYFAHQIAKEVMSLAGAARSVADLGFTFRI